MPRLAYESKKLGPDKLAIIRRANSILDTYAEQGFVLTLRQVYYQFVARDLFPDERTWTWTGAKWVRDPRGTKNAEPNYKYLGDVLTDGRMSGLIDWDLLEDRTRNLEVLAHWRDPSHIVNAISKQFRVEKWANQPNYVEVWIEKDALVGVIEPICHELDVPYFSCRGYTSLSEMWVAGQRLMHKIEDNKRVTIIHLGDHDPSGIDMSRDIEDRLSTFLATDHLRFMDDPPPGLDGHELAEYALDWLGERFTVNRIALNMDQIRQYNPPPNPAKLGDSRSGSYIREYGRESWELDALEPTVIADLIEDAVLELRDESAWVVAQEKEEQHRKTLARASSRWDDVAKFLNGNAS